MFKLVDFNSNKLTAQLFTSAQEARRFALDTMPAALYFIRPATDEVEAAFRAAGKAVFA